MPRKRSWGPRPSDRLSLKPGRAAAISALAAAACLFLPLAGPPASAQAPGGRGATPVEVAIAERAAAGDLVRLVGTVVPRLTATLGSEVEGRLERWYVEEGGRAEKGAKLCGLDTRRLARTVELHTAAVAEAQAGLASAQALAREASIELERVSQLAAEDLTATSVLDTAEATRDARDASVASWRAQLERHRAELARAQLDLEQATLHAPFGGVLVEKLKEVGEWTRVGDGLARLSSLSDLEVEAAASVEDLVQLATGQRARVTAEATVGEPHPATVSRIVRQADPGVRTYPVVLALAPDGIGELEAGMLVRVEVTVGEPTERLLVPKDAIVFRGNGRRVYVVPEGASEVEEREVRMGRVIGERVEILEGVHDGEAVVVTGNEGLRDGTAVRVGGGPRAGAPAAP